MKEIVLTKGKVALVDDDDFELLSKYKWSAKFAHKGTVRDIWYAKRGTRKGGIQKTFSMHRFILGITNTKIEVDHIDGNGLNNQRSNLRSCSSSQNRMNCIKRSNSSSKYKGVYWYNLNQKWHARISLDQKVLHVGFYSDEKEAALAYNCAASFAYREFAQLNKI